MFVTDYTHKPGVREVEMQWCPPNLNDKVLQIGMWENAERLGSEMKPGEFWTLNNMRLKTTPDGCFEGTFSEVHQAHRLTEGKDGLTNPHFAALLQFVKFIQYRVCQLMCISTGVKRSGEKATSVRTHLSTKLLLKR